LRSWPASTASRRRSGATAEAEVSAVPLGFVPLPRFPRLCRRSSCAFLFGEPVQVVQNVDGEPPECARAVKPVAQAQLVLIGCGIEAGLADLLELQDDD
jgi:hypothetical protein